MKYAKKPQPGKRYPEYHAPYDAGREDRTGQNNRTIKNPWLTDEQKVVEPNRWDLNTGPLAALFKDPGETEDVDDVFYKGELGFFRKMGRLEGMLRRSKIRKEYDFENKCWYVSRVIFAGKSQHTIVHAVYAHEGKYWLTNADYDKVYVEEKSWTKFRKAMLAMSVWVVRGKEII